MPLVKVQCANCGGILAVDRESATAMCPFCNTPYILEKPAFGSEAGNAVPKDPDGIVRDGVLHIRMDSYADSFDIFHEYAKSCPDDWRGWYGMAVADYLREPAEGFKLSAEVWAQFPEHVRERKEETEYLAGLASKIRQEELVFSETEDRCAYSALLQRIGIREDERESAALLSHMDAKYKGMMYRSAGFGIAALAGLILLIAGLKIPGLILFALAAVGMIAMLASGVWGHSFDGEELNMNVSEIRKKRERLREEAEDKQRLVDGIGRRTEEQRELTAEKIETLMTQIEAELQKHGAKTLPEYLLDVLE